MRRRSGSGCHPDWKPSRDGTSVAFEVDDIDATIAKLKERGVTFEMDKIETPVCWMAQFRDPDGNKLLVHQAQNCLTIMSVLVDKNTRLCVQGITGSAGGFHAQTVHGLRDQCRRWRHPG